MPPLLYLGLTSRTRSWCRRVGRYEMDPQDRAAAFLTARDRCQGSGRCAGKSMFPPRGHSSDSRPTTGLATRNAIMGHKLPSKPAKRVGEECCASGVALVCSCAWNGRGRIFSMDCGHEAVSIRRTCVFPGVRSYRVGIAAKCQVLQEMELQWAFRGR